MLGTTTVTSELTAGVLTNLRTRNIGNLALSSRILERARAAYGDAGVYPIHRVPHPLADHVTRAQDPNRWLARVERLAGSPSSWPDDESSMRGIPQTPGSTSETAEADEVSAPLRIARRLAHTRPGELVRAVRSRPDARRHLGALGHVDHVIWNPGGEINAYSTPRGRMLDLEVALQLGKPAAIVNFSFEPTDELRAYVRQRARRLSLVAVRDARSASMLADLGVPEDRLHIVPDAVFTTPPPPPTRRAESTGRTGIVFHGLTDATAARWADLIRRLDERGHDLVILSSHLVVDRPFIRDVLARAGVDVPVAPEIVDVDEYMDVIGGLRAMVTGRFHSAVLALVCGTVVAGLDTYGTKVREGLTAAGMERYATSEADWVESAIEIIESAAAPAPDVVAGLAQGIRDSYASLLPLGAE